MPVIHKSRPTSRDIDEITTYIARDSIDAALRWFDQLDDFFKVIAASPGIGTSRHSVSPGLRSVPFGNYLVFFRKTRGGIEIVRVIHGARKWKRLLKDVD